LIGKLESGQVVIDRPNSHIHAGVAELLPEALSRVFLAGEQFSVQEVQFGRVVGVTTCVETSGSDIVVFAQRPRRFGLSRFVKNRQPEPCSNIVVILKAGGYGEYILITAFVGQKAEPEPWDRNATDKSVAFWNSHALIWGSESVIPGSETPTCPWE
jgi:hypothetical protein